MALILGIVTWFSVNHTLIYTKTIVNIPIKVINLPEGKTVSGFKSEAISNNTISLSITGNKNVLDFLSANDLLVVIDGQDKKTTFNTIITANNIISKNPSIKIERDIKKIKPEEVEVNITNSITDKISVFITDPVGEPPKGYQFYDVRPCTLSLSVTGPEEIVKNLKLKGLKLTYNLSDISEEELYTLEADEKTSKNDIISYYVPSSWKKIVIPELSNSPMEIDDPNANSIRVDFTKQDFLEIKKPIPVVLYFPDSSSDSLNPSLIKIANNDLVKKINGIDMITSTLFAENVSQRFLDTISDRMVIMILVQDRKDGKDLEWNIQVVLPLEQEKLFATKSMKDETFNKEKLTQPYVLEDFLKMRFRTYMNRFRLWVSPTQKLHLKITLKDNLVYIEPKN